MVNGLLSELDDYNCRTLAEAAGHASPYRMQHLLRLAEAARTEPGNLGYDLHRLNNNPAAAARSGSH